MRKHACATPGCGGEGEHPLCLSCWRRVPPALRKAARDALAKGDEAGARDAVARAAASVAGLSDEPAVTTEAVFNWELAYPKAGKPSMKERRER